MPIASRRCRLVPAAIMIANASTNRNSAVETFGCATMRPAAMPTTSIGRQICQSPRWLWKKAARYAITATFMSSEGWNVTGPSGSQRRASPVSGARPATRTRTSSASVMP